MRIDSTGFLRREIVNVRDTVQNLSDTVGGITNNGDLTSRGPVYIDDVSVNSDDHSMLAFRGAVVSYDDELAHFDGSEPAVIDPDEGSDTEIAMGYTGVVRVRPFYYYEEDGDKNKRVGLWLIGTALSSDQNAIDELAATGMESTETAAVVFVVTKSDRNFSLLSDSLDPNDGECESSFLSLRSPGSPRVVASIARKAGEVDGVNENVAELSEAVDGLAGAVEGLEEAIGELEPGPGGGGGGGDVGPDGIVSNEVVFEPNPENSENCLKGVGSSVVRVMGIRLEAGTSEDPGNNIFTARRLSGGAQPSIKGGCWGGFIITCKRWVKAYDTDPTRWACAAITVEAQEYASKEAAEAAIAAAISNKLLYPYWLSSGGLDWSVPVGHVVVKARDQDSDDYYWTDADGFDTEAEVSDPPDAVEFVVYPADGIEDGGISLPLPSVISDVHARIEVLTNEKMSVSALNRAIVKYGSYIDTASTTDLQFVGEYVAGPDHDIRLIRSEGVVGDVAFEVPTVPAGKWFAAFVDGKYNGSGDPNLILWHPNGAWGDTREGALEYWNATSAGGDDHARLGTLLIQAGASDHEWGVSDWGDLAVLEKLTSEFRADSPLVSALFAKVREMETAPFIPPQSDPGVAGAVWNNGGTLAISTGA